MQNSIFNIDGPVNLLMIIQHWFHQETDRFPIQKGGKNRYLSVAHFHAKHVKDDRKRASVADNSVD